MFAVGSTEAVRVSVKIQVVCRMVCVRLEPVSRALSSFLCLRLMDICLVICLVLMVGGRLPSSIASFSFCGQV